MRILLPALLALAASACATSYGAPGQKAGGDTEIVCHKGKKTMELPREAVNAHMAHGDSYGPCLTT